MTSGVPQGSVLDRLGKNMTSGVPQGSVLDRLGKNMTSGVPQGSVLVLVLFPVTEQLENKLNKVIQW